MQGESLRHDVAWATAQHILKMFSGILYEHEKAQAFAEAYECVKAGLECYEIKAERMIRHLHPNNN